MVQQRKHRIKRSRHSAGQTANTGTSAGGANRRPPPPRTWAHALARWMILPLVNTSVTPNQITTVRLITGIVAAGMFAVGSQTYTVLGGWMFMFSALIDRADGELARLSGRTSPGGHAYDFKCDAVSSSLVFLGIGIGLRFGSIGWGSGLLGLIAAGSVGGIYWIVTRIEGAKRDGKPVFTGVGRFDPDDALFLLGPIAWMGDLGLWPLLISAAIGAPIFAGWAVYRDRRFLFSVTQ